MYELDQYLFVLINSTLSNAFFDWLMPLITDLHKSYTFKTFILPVLLVTWFVKKRRKALPVFIGLILSVGASDLVAYRVLKPHFKRPRPPAVEETIQLRTDRYAGYSFPSNHAANNFAGATFLSYCYPALTPVFFAVASLIAYSRVYVGVHYPLDVGVGALLGFIFGLSFFKILYIILNRNPVKVDNKSHETLF